MAACRRRFRPETRAKLDAVLPSTWSKVNPVDIVGDADAARYCAALDALLDDGENDAVLVVNVETALASGVETANAVADFLKGRRGRMANSKPALALWVGASEQVTAVFDRANIPHFATEADAVQGFAASLVRHGEADQRPDGDAAGAACPSISRPTAHGGARAGRALRCSSTASWLDPLEAGKTPRRPIAIPMVPTGSAPATPQQAETLAAPFSRRRHARWW